MDAATCAVSIDGMRARGSRRAIAAAAVFGLYATLRHGTSILGSDGWMAFPVLIATAFAAVVSWPSPWLSRLVASLAACAPRADQLLGLPLPPAAAAPVQRVSARCGRYLAFPVWLATVVAVAAVSYRYVEVPYLLRGRRREHSPSSKQAPRNL